MSLPQERLDTIRQGLADTKKKNHALVERVQSMQSSQGDLELRRLDLDSQNRQLQEVGYENTDCTRFISSQEALWK